ncbi:MAG: hypothetical protein LBS93_00805, partial [Synergistaceae bacterium]|nr:hypothetical protein [Synergistaceae bacterium]
IYNGEERVNIGVTLISGQNDSPATLKKLASMAERSELLAGPTVMTEYDGKGLGVWMNIR